MTERNLNGLVGTAYCENEGDRQGSSFVTVKGLYHKIRSQNLTKNVRVLSEM